MSPKELLTKEYLELEYIQNKKSIQTIASELGLKSYNSVTQYIKKFGLYRPPVKDISKILTREYLYNKYVKEKFSLKDIADEVGSSKAVIKKYLILREIPLRKKGFDLTKRQEEKFYNYKTDKTDLLGHVFGNLKVIELSHVNKRKNLVWKCECQCENKNIILVSGCDLRRNSVKSCGCLKAKLKEEWERILTKEFLYKEIVENNKSLYGLAREIEIPPQKVRYFINKFNIEYVYKQEFSIYEDIPISLFNKIKSNANKNKIDFNVDIEYIWDIFVKQETKCKYTNILLTFPKSTYEHKHNLYTASLDRIDSTKGYIKGNLQWTHKVINIMKNNMSEEEFLNWCKLVSDNIK